MSKPIDINVPQLFRELLQMVNDLADPFTLARNSVSQIAALKSFCETARPLIQEAVHTVATETPARQVLMAMKHVELQCKGVIWKSTDVPNFFLLKTQLADALENGLIPFNHEDTKNTKGRTG